jgi:hypothetical protein
MGGGLAPKLPGLTPEVFRSSVSAPPRHQLGNLTLLQARHHGLWGFAGGSDW